MKINIFAFWSHQARAYMHHTCQLVSPSPPFLFLFPFWSFFRPKSAPLARLEFFPRLPVAPLSLQKSLKTNEKSTFSLFGPTKPKHICIILASSCLQARCSSFCSLYGRFGTLGPELSKTRSLETPSGLGGNREAKSISSFSVSGLST